MSNFNKFESTGIEFEETIIEKCGTISKETWGASAFKFSTLTQDKMSGTDFFVLGIPVDVTLNLENKRHTKISSDIEIDLAIAKVRFGVRFGNGRVKFETPVLVIGFDTMLGRRDVLTIASSISKSKFVEILNSGMDFYFDTVEC